MKTLIVDAGIRLKRQFGRVKTIHYKEGSTINLVTNVDRDIENFIKTKIRKEFPQDSILAEESPAENMISGRKWIIDPLDGTTNFAHGLPIFCISIGVEEEGEIVNGAVYNPASEELFLAKKGKGATFNNRKIHVSSTRTMRESLLVTGFPYTVHSHPEHSLPYFNKLIQHAQGLRRLGSAAIDLCYLAAARFDGFFEVYLNPWDTAAGMLILTEAGGQITDFNGNRYSIYQRELAATNGYIHSEMIKLLKEVKETSFKRVAK